MENMSENANNIQEKTTIKLDTPLGNKLNVHILNMIIKYDCERCHRG